MNFYRPATLEDFDAFEVAYSNFHSMDEDTKVLIEQGDIRKAMFVIRQRFGFGLADCKRYCLKYQTFVTAKKDFEQGKPVFVSY